MDYPEIAIISSSSSKPKPSNAPEIDSLTTNKTNANGVCSPIKNGGWSIWNGIACQIIGEGIQKNGILDFQLDEDGRLQEKDSTSPRVLTAIADGGDDSNLALIKKPYLKFSEDEKAKAVAIALMSTEKFAKLLNELDVTDASGLDWDENTIGENIQEAFYSTHARYPIQIANTNVKFYIQPKLPAAATIPFDADQFEFIVCKQNSKLTHKVRVEKSDYVESANGDSIRRFTCSFHPAESGLYLIIVSMRTSADVSQPKHLDGSPFFITVVKNYVKDSSKPVGIKIGLSYANLDALHGHNGHSPPSSSSSPTNQMIVSFSNQNVIKYKGMNYYTQPASQNGGRVRVEDSNESFSKVKPWGITYCPRTDEIFVCTRETHEVQKFSATTGEYLGSFGTQGRTYGKFCRPTAITYDGSNHRLIISDKDNHRICFCTVDGLYQASFGSRGHRNGQFNYPWGVDVSRDGQFIVVADSRNHRIQIFNKHGIFVNKYSVFEKTPFEYKDQFNYPRGVTFDNNGQFIYVSDFNLNVVLSVDIDCTRHSQLELKSKQSEVPLQRPQGMAVDLAGNIIICDTKSNCLHVVCPTTGALCTTIGGFGKPKSVQYHRNGTNGGFQLNHRGNGSTNLCDYDALEAPMDLCFVKSGKLAVLDGIGIIRIF